MPSRHRASSMIHMYGLNYCADHTNGKLYEYSLDIYDDDGEPIIKQRDTAAIHGGLFGVPGQKLNFDEVEFIILNDTGEVAGTGQGPQRPALLTLEKTVVGGAATQDNFPAFVGDTPQDWDVATPWAAGDYVVSETAHEDYTAGDWGGDAAADGTITLVAGESATATITNTYTGTNPVYLLHHSGDDQIEYYAIDSILKTVTVLGTQAANGSSKPTVVSDGTLILAGSGNGIYDLECWSWNGTTFDSQVSQGAVDSQTITFLSGRGVSGGNNLWMCAGSGPRGDGVSVGEWSSSAISTPTSVTTWAYDSTRNIIDFRKTSDAQGVFDGYGKLYIAMQVDPSIGKKAGSYTVTDGGTVSLLSTLTMIRRPLSDLAWDRDTGDFGYRVNPTQIELYNIDLSTGALSNTGTITISEVTEIPAFAFKHGKLIVFGADKILRSYSISGTTATLIDTYDPSWSLNTPSIIHSDPFTRNMIIASPATGDANIFQIDDDGIFDLTASFSVNAALGWQDITGGLLFMSTPLEVTP